MSESLVDAIDTLREALHEFTREVALPFPEPGERLKSLASTVQSIGNDRPVKLRNCPDEYRAQWRAFLAGRREDLERSAVRFLCWEPEVVADQRFHEYLDKTKTELNTRGLHGMISSVHQRWSDKLSEGPVGASLRERLRTYSGLNPKVTRWKREVRVVAGADGPSLFGARLVEALRPIGEITAEWGLMEDSAFSRHAVGAATEACGKQLRPGSPLISFFVDHLIGWRGLDQATFKDQLGHLMLSEQAAALEELRQGLKRLALDRLGDPRLPRNAAAWLGVPAKARDEFLKWLSRDDIAFFFGHVLPQGSDPHGRKSFWLKYVSRVKRSRPLLCNDDENRLRSQQKRNLESIGHYGRIAGSSSAFLLDFGEVLVIEFSAYGNACLVYERKEAAKVVPEFWQTQPFSRATLRMMEVAGRLAHQFGWQEAMSNFLAGYGIRPRA